MLASSTQFVLSLDPALDSIYHSLHDVRPGITSLQRVLCSLVFTCAVCVNECLSVPLILTKEKYLPKMPAYLLLVILSLCFNLVSFMSIETITLILFPRILITLLLKTKHSKLLLKDHLSIHVIFGLSPTFFIHGS